MRGAVSRNVAQPGTRCAAALARGRIFGFSRRNSLEIARISMEIARISMVFDPLFMEIGLVSMENGPDSMSFEPDSMESGAYSRSLPRTSWN
jgi:hypothetical protein